RNTSWRNVALADVISMPDEWEYPWFAAWDTAFHTIPLAHVDPDFAKEQLLLMCREWAMHPNGQLPAYEWAFGDVNPPVHAWAAWHVYRIDGYRDQQFLIRVFTKLLLNFSWWVNRKEDDGFFYDVLVAPDGTTEPLRVPSMVGLLPILGATEIPAWVEERLPDVADRVRWLQKRRPELIGPLRSRSAPEGRRMLLSLVG